MSADWVAIEAALYQWATAHSGVTVIWARQVVDLKRPQGQHVSLQLQTGTPIGSTPSKHQSYNDAAPLGEEITLTNCEIYRTMLEVQTIGAVTNGNSSARALATKLQMSLGLTSVRDALNAVGVSVIDRGTVNHVPEILDADWEPRAYFDVELFISDSVSEKTGYIASVEIEDTSAGKTFVIDSE